MEGSTEGNVENGEPARELTHAEIWDDTLLIKQYDETMDKARKALAYKLPTASSATESEHSHSHRTENIGSMHPTTHCQRKKKKKGRKRNEWQAGDHCRSHYFEDENVYEATIIAINQTTGKCTVRYLGYNNEEDVALSSLLRSNGDAARKKQIAESHCNNYSESEETADDSSILDSDAPMDSEKVKNGFDKLPHSTMMPPPQQPAQSRQNPFSMPHLPDLPPPPALGLVDSDDSSSSEALHTMLMSWYMTGYHTGYYQGISRARKETKSSSRKNNRKSNKYR